MVHFPQSPNFTGFNTPSRVEADVRDLPFEGTIPRELDGAFYRVQPDPQFAPMLGDDIVFICGHGPTSTIGEERRSNPFVS